LSAIGVHKITEEFELALAKYTGAPYAVATDNASSALFLCLIREKVAGKTIHIPCRTYPSVPEEIIWAGGKVGWIPVEGTTLTGAYQLIPTRIWDSALRFTADMYILGSLMCISFSGPYKHLKLGKGGAILCDNEKDFEWFKRARNSGRGEMSYHQDTFTILGKNSYMHPSVSALGLQLIGQCYELDGIKKHFPDQCLPYPDLSLPCHTAFKT
jgi:dTDP-4-amino-4,6-dideoxygalactose transaminase